MRQNRRTSAEVALFLRNRFAPLAGVLLLAGLCVGPAGATRFQDDPPADPPKPKAEPGAVEVRFADNSVLKLTLREEKIEIATPYGKLLVPVADIQNIEFATRIPEADAKRIPVLVEKLGSSEFSVRDAAGAELLKLQQKAYPALLQAAKHKDPEIVRRATDLLDKIRDAVPAENLEVRPHDVIHTENSKFTGHISAATFKANTSQFGEVTVKLMDVRSLHAAGFVEPEKAVANAPPAPPSLMQLQNQIGKTFHFTVTGAVNGAVWGTDVYTLDSTLGMAAVHAGVVKPGQTKVVKVKILPAQAAYTGSVRHGVASAEFAVFPGSFQFVK